MSSTAPARPEGRIAVANSNPAYGWFERRAATELDASLIDTPAALNARALADDGIARVVFPHWSSIIPAEVYERFECILFHMTDLPYGRGGSPLQNLIVRGHETTMLTAIRVAGGIDTGPIYLKRPLSLNGTATEIFLRAERIMWDMTLEILRHDIQPQPQTGEAAERFRRRKPQDGSIAELTELSRVYDHIRMLDGEGYPRAFVDLPGLRLEFSRASLKPDEVIADVRITKR